MESLRRSTSLVLVFLVAANGVLAENYSLSSIKDLAFEFDGQIDRFVGAGERQSVETENVWAMRRADGGLWLKLRSGDNLTEIASLEGNSFSKDKNEWRDAAPGDEDARTLFLEIVSAWRYYQRLFGSSLSISKKWEGKKEGRAIRVGIIELNPKGRSAAFEGRSTIPLAVSGLITEDIETGLPLSLQFSGKLQVAPSLIPDPYEMGIKLKMEFKNVSKAESQ